jgi:hypothetical protein
VQSANAQVVFEGATGTIADTADYTSQPLTVNGLRNVVFVIQQLTGLGSCDVTLQAAFRWDNGLEVSWRDIAPTQILNVGGGLFPVGAGIPTVYELNIACEMIRLRFVNSSGGAVTCAFILLASG